jgi:hypothetical protein
MNKMYAMSVVLLSIVMLAGGAIMMPIAADEIRSKNDCVAKCKKESTLCLKNAEHVKKNKASAKNKCNKTFSECQAKCISEPEPPEGNGRGGSGFKDKKSRGRDNKSGRY